eukprot:scaffold696_cov197-Alexandrium_tamarense.AAC.8
MILPVSLHMRSSASTLLVNYRYSSLKSLFQNTGATLMAAGASSPELLCTLVSLFITHSSLGLGTIVGSEIFNLLIICAGSVYASKSHEHGKKYIVLDRVMVVREVGFYGLSIGLLYLALSERGSEADGEVEHIYISFWKACLLFGGYALYVVVCSNMELCVKCICFLRRRFGFGGKNEASFKENEEATYQHSEDEVEMSGSVRYRVSDNGGCIVFLSPSVTCSHCQSNRRLQSFEDHELHQLPFIYNISTEPIENWDTAESSDDIYTCNSDMNKHNETENHDNTTGEKKRNILSNTIHKSLKLMKANHLLCSDEYPVEMNDVYELTNNEGFREISCFLWQRSIFYSKAYFGLHAFHLRWFSITPTRISSVPDRHDPKKHIIVYPLFDELHVDENRMIINIVNPVDGKRDFTLMAPSKSIFEAIVHAFKLYMEVNQPLRLQGMTELDDDGGDDAARAKTKQGKRDNDADPHVTLIEFPSNASPLEIALWISLYPLRLVMHHTLPDVRHLDRHGDPTSSIGYAYLSTATCLMWLIVGSYAMVTSLEKLAALLRISDSVMGVTVSAAGTSLPAYIASRMAAERGFGNQAVANVFGSNTFNITVGLGLPWVLYIAVTGESYHDLENEGIAESMLILIGTLLLFIVLMLSTKFVLLKWHADIFVVLYIIYVVFALAKG